MMQVSFAVVSPLDLLAPALPRGESDARGALAIRAVPGTTDFIVFEGRGNCVYHCYRCRPALCYMLTGN